VIVLDNLEPFYEVRLKGHTLDVHREVANVHEGSYTFLEREVRDAETVQDGRRRRGRGRPLGGQAGVQTCVAEPRKVSDINVGGAVMLLEAAKEADIERVILLSSSSVHGKPESLPPEEAHPRNRWARTG